jgi:hypothetical protein
LAAATNASFAGEDVEFVLHSSTGESHSVKALPELERSYFAGIVDGEGCISLARREKYITITLQITNTNRPLLEWIQTRFSGGIYPVKDKRPTRKQSWLWSVAGAKALRAISEAYPYLLIKLPQAKIVLSLPRQYAAERDRRGRIMGRLTTEDVLANEALITQIRQLNRRGAADVN